MTLPELIKYRDLANQLSQQETQQLMHQFSEQHGQLILSALFMHLRTTMISDPEWPESTKQVLDDMNRFICSIVEAREKNTPNDDETIMPKKLCDLPKALIGVTASFLEQKSYARLSGACRSIYLGCNAPNQLHTLDVRRLTSDTFVDLRRFASVKSFKFKPTQFARLTAPIEGTVMNHLNHVVISGKDNIDAVLADTHITMGNVTTLECLNLCRLRSAQFARLRAKFSNVKHLNLRDLNMASSHLPSVRDSFVSPYSDLRGLELFSMVAMSSLLSVVGHRLEFLKLLGTSNNSDVSGVNFSRLSELALSAYHDRSHQTIADILKTAVHLRKVSIRMGSSPQTNVRTEGIVQFFTRCKQLEYFEIDGPHSPCEWIVEALFETLSLQRNSLKIRIRSRANDDNKHLAMKVLRTVHWLQMRNIQDFMLILEVGKKALDAITGLPDNVVVNRTDEKLVISNANCRISGYLERWMNPMV